MSEKFQPDSLFQALVAKRLLNYANCKPGVFGASATCL